MTPGELPKNWMLLAQAYTDGELDRARRRLVESWMRARPEVADLVREFRMTNELLRIPEPETVDLRRSGEIIAGRLATRPRRRWIRSAIGFSLAASVGFALWHSNPAPTPHVAKTQVQSKPAVDPLAEFDDLPIATARDAEVTQIRGDSWPVFLGGDGEWPEQIELATIDEMQIERTGRSRLTMPSPGDAPMIFQTSALR